MPNLLWNKNKITNKLLSTPFKSEENFEKFILDTPEILEDIFLIKHQVNTGGKAGIPDIIGIDNDGNVCIIEMKNVKVDASIIPQVLKYAIWAESNPDSIRALWLQTKDPPSDIEINWDKLQVKVIIIAPNVLPSTLQFVDKIHYVVELLEINLWQEGSNKFILVNKLKPEKSSKTGPTKGLPEYNREYYEKYRNKESVIHFYKYVAEVEKIIKQKGWSLESKFNKNNVSFKAGFFLAFRITWIGSKTFAFAINVSESQANSFKPKMTKYIDKRKRAQYYIEPGKTKTAEFVPLFEIAYKKLTGA